MPRPPVKRSKLNHQNQAAKRVPNNSLGSSPAARRRQLQDQLAHKPIGRVPTDSDDSDELVTKTRNPRNRRGVPRQEIYCSGGVAQNDQIAAHKSPSKKRHHVSPKQAFTGIARVNGTRGATAPAPRGLRAIDRLSRSKPSQISKTGASTNAKPSPLGLIPSNATRVQPQETPTAEPSILGPTKLRKRQPSSLRLFDAPESPVLEQDFDEFLPDDESTPLNASRKRKLSPTPTASAPIPPVGSPPENAVLDAATKSGISPEPELPAAPWSGADNDTMALPRSSSSAPSPAQLKAPSPIRQKAKIRKSKEAQSLSTSALQALMPARRQQRTRRHGSAKATGEFDIPEDSSDAQNDTTAEVAGDSAADDSYLITARPDQKGKRQTRARLQKNKKPPTVNRKKNIKQSQTDIGGTNGKTRNRKISTQSPSIRRATPSSPAAKTSLQHRDYTITYNSGALPRKIYSLTDKHGPEDEDGVGPEDKENRPSGLFVSSSRKGRENTRLGEPPPSTDEDADEIELGRGGVRAMSADDVDDESRMEQVRLTQKFKEVDEWEMDFEDVTFNEGSDPLAR